MTLEHRALMLHHFRHCERSEAIQRAARGEAGLLRCARNDDSDFTQAALSRSVRFEPFDWLASQPLWTGFGLKAEIEKPAASAARGASTSLDTNGLGSKSI